MFDLVRLKRKGYNGDVLFFCDFILLLLYIDDGMDIWICGQFLCGQGVVWVEDFILVVFYEVWGGFWVVIGWIFIFFWILDGYDLVSYVYFLFVSVLYDCFVVFEFECFCSVEYSLGVIVMVWYQDGGLLWFIEGMNGEWVLVFFDVQSRVLESQDSLFFSRLSFSLEVWCFVVLIVLWEYW